MKTRATIVSIAVLLAIINANALPALGGADRIKIGALKSTLVVAEVADVATIGRVLQFVESQRSLNWSAIPVKHGCGSILLTFYSAGASVGYLAWGPTEFGTDSHGAFYTNGLKGQVTKTASRQETAAFKELLPKDLKVKGCATP